MSDPTFGAIYAPPGRGKTLALIRAFPDALFVSPKGGLTCASWLDWKPKELRAKGIRIIPEVVKKYASKFPAIIFCDLSIEGDAEARRLRGEYSGWTVWDKYGEHFLDARDAAREANCHVWWEFHESPPKLDGGEVVRPGTFSLAGFQAAEKIPGMLDVIAHVEYSTDHLGAALWPYVLSTAPSDRFITKDRLSIFPRKFPMNIREPLLARGYDLPRPKALAWMDKVTDVTADRVEQAARTAEGLADVDIQEVARGVVASLKGKNPRHVRWAILDGVDRAWLQLQEANLLDEFVDLLGEDNSDGSI